MATILLHSDAPAATLPPPATTASTSPGLVEWITDSVGRRRYLVRRPWLDRDGAGAPVLSMSLLLRRNPRPDERAILDLVDQAWLTFGVALRVPAGTLDTSGELRPEDAVFARLASYRLINAEGRSVAAVEASGPGAKASMTVRLEASATAAVVAALAGELTASSGLRLVANVSLDAAPAPQRWSVRWSWADAYQAILEHAGSAEWFAIDVIERAVMTALSCGALTVTPGLVSADPAVALRFHGWLVRRFAAAASMILEWETYGTITRFRLGERPHPQFVWSLDEAVTLPSVQERKVEAGLDDVLRGALVDQVWDRHIRVVSHDGSAPGIFRPLPRRARGVQERTERSLDASQSLTVATIHGKALDASTFAFPVRPQLRPNVALTSGVHESLIADAVLEDVKAPELRSLPIHTGEKAALMSDRLTPALQWYVPALEIVTPGAGSEPDTSPFLFRFERQGVTDTGEIAMTAKIRCRLRMVMPQPVRDASASRDAAMVRPVEPLDFSVQLSLPFIDSADGTLKRAVLQGAAERQGRDFVVTIEVSNRWVRLAYGVLSTPGFQGSESARLAYSFRYECYRRTHGKLIRPILGQKQVSLPVHWSADSVQASEQVQFHAATATLSSGQLKIRFAGERAEARRSAQLDKASVHNAMVSLSARPTSSVIAEKPLPIVVQPELTEVTPIVQEFVYAQQSIGIQGALDVLMPCSQYGAFYQERMPEGWRSIGCQDALRLGELPARTHEQLTELTTSSYSVYRCLTQPGRFLVVPKAYCITRYPPGHERAWLPAAMVFAVLDPEQVEGNRYRFVASLEPAIAPHEIRSLQGTLTPYAPGAAITLDWPTDAAASVDLPSVPLAGAISPPQFTVAGAGVQVVLETSLPDALILRRALEITGILGRLEFLLNDGTNVGSDLEIHLARIMGPWLHGPVSAERTASGCRLTNHIDVPVEVTEVLVFSGNTPGTAIPVNQQIAGGGTLDLSAPELEGDMVPVCTPRASSVTLEESRIFIEDVLSNVVFTCGINFATRGLLDLEVYARLMGSTEEQRVTLQPGMPRVGEARFTVPLSVVVDNSSAPLIEYRVTRVLVTGERLETSWQPCRGALVDLQWDNL